MTKDICKCSGEKCKVKNQCLRYTSKPLDYGQSWADFYKQPKNKQGKCGMFMGDKK